MTDAITTQFWFGDTKVTRLARTEKPAREAIVIFHGFPGQPPAAEVEKYRNVPRMRIELAKALVAANQIDAYLPSYEGLGESRGKFRFDRSVTRSGELALEIAARGYRRLHVAGHSWGGLVAFNVHRSLGARAGRLVLLAGLLDLESEQRVRTRLSKYLVNYPEILGSDAGALDRAAADLDGTRRSYNPMTLAEPLPEDVLMIAHGRPDLDVDVGISRRFHKKAGGRYLELEDDHGFSGDMPRLIDEAVRFISQIRGP